MGLAVMITDPMPGMTVRVGPAREEILATPVCASELGVIWQALSGNFVLGRRDVSGTFIWTLTDIVYRCEHCGGLA